MEFKTDVSRLLFIIHLYTDSSHKFQFFDKLIQIYYIIFK